MARYVLFGKTKRLILFHHGVNRQHIKRVHYQTVIWEKAYLPLIDAPTPAHEVGVWMIEGVLVPVNHAKLISVAPSAAAVEVRTFHVHLCAIALTEQMFEIVKS